MLISFAATKQGGVVEVEEQIVRVNGVARANSEASVVRAIAVELFEEDDGGRKSIFAAQKPLRHKICLNFSRMYASRCRAMFSSILTLPCGWSVVRAWLLSVLVVFVFCGWSRVCASVVVLSLCGSWPLLAQDGNLLLEICDVSALLGSEHDLTKGSYGYAFVFLVHRASSSGVIRGFGAGYGVPRASSSVCQLQRRPTVHQRQSRSIARQL